MNVTQSFLPIALLVIGTGIMGLVIGLYLTLRSRSEITDRLVRYVQSPDMPLTTEEESDTILSRLRRQLNSIFAIISSEEMQRKLIAADWPLTVSEYYLISIGLAVSSLLLGAIVFQNLFSGIGLAILAYATPGFLLFRGIQIRQKRFQEQLIDALTLLRGSIEAGYSFLQALNIVIGEMDAPACDEFRQVRREVELGLPLNRALNNMAGRMESDDFYLVVTAVNINSQTGGNLSTILRVVIETIRNRIYLFSEVRSLTAYAQYASYLLTFLPFITVVTLSILSPKYMENLLDPGITRIILIYAICSMIIGNILLRRIASIDV